MIACALLTVFCSAAVIGAGKPTNGVQESSSHRLAADQLPRGKKAREESIAGVWQGTLVAGSTRLQLVLKIVGKADGSFSASVDSPDQGATGLMVDSITVTGDSLTFEMKSLWAVYEGTFGEDREEISGQWKQAGAVLPLTFKRPGKRQADARTQTALRKIDAGGHRLSMLFAGDGTPTVILEAGFGGAGIPSWGSIHREVARFTRVISYDRAGLGQSERGPRPRTARQVARELRTALKFAGIKPPYVMVGHSLGGLFVRVFTGLYPKEVAGMILIDPSQEEFEDWLESHHVETPKLDEAQMANAPAGFRDENAALDATYRDARTAKVPPNTPVTLLTAMNSSPGMPPEIRNIWIEKQKAWLKRVPHARHILAERSGHFIQIDEPELVIDAIKQLVTRFRTQRRQRRV